MKRLLFLAVLLMMSVPLFAQNNSAQGWCEQGGTRLVVNPGITSTGLVQASYPQCLVTVFIHNTQTPAVIFADDNIPPTPLANPFTSTTFGHWQFYAANTAYDVVLSGGGFPAPFTLRDVLIPGTGGGGPTSPACNPTVALSTAITSAYNLLPATGGVIDCTASGNSSLLSDPFSPMVKNVSVIMPVGAITSAVPITTPPNVVVTVNNGGCFTNSASLTFNGPLNAGLYKIFCGSVAPSINKNFTPVFRIQWFGALVNGSNDDSAAWNATIGASTTGGKLVFCGISAVSSFVQIQSNWELEGCGVGAQVLATTTHLPSTPDTVSASGILYVAQNATNIKIHNLYVKGAYTGTGASDYTFGIRVGTGATNVHIYNNLISNNSWSGIILQGSGHTVNNNYSVHNAIDGIESFATETKILGNTYNDDGAASANGNGCIEILPTSAQVQISDNICISADHGGILLSSGGASQNEITISHNTIFQPNGRGINDQNGTTNLIINNNTIEKPQGSGALGHGIYLANTVGFRIEGNTVIGLTTGSGPSAIQVDGTCDNGQILDNFATGAWIGLAVTGSCGTNFPIYINANQLIGNMAGDYTNISSGTKIYLGTNIIGNAQPNQFTPNLFGGNLANSTITVSGTTGNGTGATPNIIFGVANDALLEAGRICNNAHWTIGDTNCSLENFAIVNDTFGVRSTSTSPATMNLTSSNGSGNQWQFLSKNTGHLTFFNNSANAPGLEINGAGNVGVAQLASSTATTVCYDSTTISGFFTLTTCSSLRRLKKDIHSLPSTAEEFMRLHPVEFTQKNDGQKRYGFIAEEVNAINPELSTYYKDELSGVDYNAVTAMLVKVVQQQQRELDQLKAKLR